ncbi:MAG: PspC domain-containing protein [Anaerolineae bacterium]|nr:PspC domain-containing protein [Anaerolineae bacterium]
MYRSFTDRVFGGVCGGLGALLPVNPWVFRIAFVILSIATLGAFAALYLLLWWLVPQESLVGRSRGGAGLLLLAIILIIITAVGWVLNMNGSLQGPTGQGLFWPGMLLALSVVFFLKQVRG